MPLSARNKLTLGDFAQARIGAVLAHRVDGENELTGARFTPEPVCGRFLNHTAIGS
jgi:hypothetical protein